MPKQWLAFLCKHVEQEIVKSFRFLCGPRNDFYRVSHRKVDKVIKSNKPFKNTNFYFELKVENKKSIKNPKINENFFWKLLCIWYNQTLFSPKKVCTFTNWTIDRAQHWFNKNWLDRQNIGFLSNTYNLLYKKKVKCTSSPVNLLYTLMYFNSKLWLCRLWKSHNR